MAEKLTTGSRSILLVSSKDYLKCVRREYAEHVADALGEELSADERDAFIDDLCAGTLALVRMRKAPRPLDRPKVVDLVDLIPDVPPKPIERPTWLEVFVVDPSGRALPRAQLELRLPDGTIRHDRVDETARWRADDLTTHGTCHLALRESPGEPSTLQRALDGKEPVARVGGGSVGLVTGRSHVLVLAPRVFQFVFSA